MTIVYLTLSWVAGIALGQQTSEAPQMVWWGLALLAAAGAVVRRRDQVHRLLLACLALGSLGILRMNAASAPPGPEALDRYNDRGWRSFEGIIIAEPDVRDQQVNLRVAVDVTSHFEEQAVVHGTALVQAPRYGDYAYGDRVRFSGTPLTPPEFDTFSYRDYLARQGVYTLVPNAEVAVLSRGHGNPLMQALLSLKRQAQALIADSLPEPQASLLTGILLGVETGIAPDVRDAFNATGASHVIAISGFNMTLIAGLLSRLLALAWPRRRTLTVILSAAAILTYTVFVGADPSVVRAAIMSILLILAPLFRRRTYVPASLAFAALVMSALDPFVLWDVGFQLSFAAVLGMALFVAPLEDALHHGLSRWFAADTARQLLRLLNEPLVVTLAAQITTLPLIALYFGRLSLSSFLVNFLILPVQAPLLILGGLATLIGLVIAPLAQPLYWGAWLFLTWTVAVVRFFAGLGGDLTAQIDGRLVALFFLGILLGAILQGTRPGWLGRVGPLLRGRRLAVLLMGVGAAMGAMLWLAAAALPDGLLHVHFLDSGHSNAVLIETPNGAHILIDGGRYPTRLLTALGDHLPFWDREIELLILTQPKDAQFAAIPAVLERYRVGQVLTNGERSETENFQALEQMLAARHIPTLPVYAGYTVETSEGVRLSVLHPPAPPAEDSDPNDEGLVLRLTYGEASFLLTPDLSDKAEGALVTSGQWLHGTVLQLAAHGSDRVSGEAFLTAVAPQAAVVQVDPGNRYGHPAQSVIERLGAVPLYRTDEHGEISFTTDGRTLWLTTEKIP